MNNYKEVKNYIHNELNITKEDIQIIINKTIENEVKKKLNDESFIESIIDKEIKNKLMYPNKGVSIERLVNFNSMVENIIVDELAAIVKERLIIKFKED